MADGKDLHRTNIKSDGAPVLPPNGCCIDSSAACGGEFGYRTMGYPAFMDVIFHSRFGLTVWDWTGVSGVDYMYRVGMPVWSSTDTLGLGAFLGFGCQFGIELPYVSAVGLLFVKFGCLSGIGLPFWVFLHFWGCSAYLELDCCL